MNIIEVTVLIFFVLLGIIICLGYELSAPFGFEYNKSVDVIINEKLKNNEITNIGSETATIGDLKIWHHRDGTRVITIYGVSMGSSFDLGCTSRRTMRKVFKKMGGLKKIRQIQYEAELRDLREDIDKNKQ